MTTNLKRICVYCGSSGRVDDAYLSAASQLGAALAQAGISLVYGGADVGCMGAMANSALEAGGEVIGVIPKGLVEKEVAHHGISELIVVEDMHSRKATMAELADGFIAAPGGLGTLEELFEMATWAQLGFHQKPMGLLNTNGFYDGLIQFLRHAKDEAFLAQQHLDLFSDAATPSSLLQKLLAQQPMRQDKWW